MPIIRQGSIRMGSSSPCGGNPNPKHRNPALHIWGAEVDFPYSPYGTQLAFMGRVISTLDRAQREGRCHVLLESPVGTLKSLSLPCSPLAWKQNYRIREGWAGVAVGSKSAPEAVTDPLHCSGGFIQKWIPQEILFLGIQSGFKNRVGVAKWKPIPKSFYCSRTHSQISQIIHEYHKTNYQVPMAVLASRKHYCTNPHVQGKENIDEECKMLLRKRDADCRELSCAICSPAVGRRLRSFCSVCKTPLHPTRNQYIVGSVISVSKVHSARLLEGRREVGAVGSMGIPVIVSDISSLDQEILDNDSPLVQSQWCEEDGCVFQPTCCTFCAPARNCLGVRVITTDVSNTASQQDLLEVAEIEESEESKLKTKVSSQSLSSPYAARTLEPIENFSYTPRQKGSGGW